MQKSRGPVVTGITAGTHIKNGMFDQVVDPRALILSVTNIWMLNASIEKIKMEASKDGHEFLPRWAAKCAACDSEYDNEPEECDSCGCTTFHSPDKTQLKRIEKLFAAPNKGPNGVEKTLKDIIQDIIFYMETISDYYLEITRNEAGEVIELWPLSSEYIRIRPDDRYFGTEPELICPHCYKDDERIHSKGVQCPNCSAFLVDSHYVQLKDRTDKVVARWGAKEVLHGNIRAYGSRIYGIPKLHAVWAASQILRWMELYQWSAYSNNKMPDSFVSFPGMEQEEVDTMLEELMEFKRLHPEARKDVWTGADAPPVVTSTMLDLKSMMSIEMAQYLREAIAINYGVSLNMLGVQTPGKLGNETEAVEVSYDTIDEVQSQVNEFFNTKLLPLFPEIEDWEFALISPKKDDLKRLADIDAVKANTITTLRSSIIDAAFDDDMNIVIRDQPKPPTPDYGFGFAGLGGEREDGEEGIGTTPEQIAESSEPPTIQEVSLAYERAAKKKDRVLLEMARTLLAEMLGFDPPPPLTDEEWNSIAEITDEEAGIDEPALNPETVEDKIKALSPRNIPSHSAIDKIQELESVFVEGVMDVYEKGITGIVKSAKKAGVTQAQLEKRIANYNKSFITEATEAAEGFAAEVYEAGLLEELGSMGIERELRFTQADKAAIELLKENPHGLFNNLKTFNEQQSVLLRDVVTQAYGEEGEFDLDDMVKNMRGMVDGERYKLERIARSDTTKISNTARKNQWVEYADTTKREYHWIIANHPFGDKRSHGPDDPCPAIVNGGTAKIWGEDVRVSGNPYTLKEIETITKGFLPHPNCRCTVTRRAEV